MADALWNNAAAQRERSAARYWPARRFGRQRMLPVTLRLEWLAKG
jgi:hypothetical protein